ncbi:HEAT repeat domain-containing protein [bacterium]|nr:HEAT repeat domain-containing protein [bacterium]
MFDNILSMSDKINLDLNTLLQECKIATGCDSESVVANIQKLEEKHSTEEIAIIYNYFLQNEHDPEVLLYIIKSINALKPQVCFDTLLDLMLLKENFKDNLSDAEKYVNLRVNTAKVISNYKDNRAVLPLMYCMNNKDEHYKVRLACAEALGKIGDKYAVTPLIDLVSDENEKSVYVRESAAIALGMIGDMRAVDSLVNILEAKKTFLNKFTFLKERVIEALGKINKPNERVFKALKNSLDDESPQVRIQAIETLMNSESREGVELIKKALSDENEEVVENAVIALYNLEGGELLESLIESEEYSYVVKEKAREILDEYENDDEE